MQWAQLTVRERIIIRVPRIDPGPLPARTPLSPVPPPRWVEKRGERCVTMDTLAGAQPGNGPGTLDFLLADGGRLRATLGDACPALDFYGGFYLRPAHDRRICAGRDAIRLRSGATCAITRFRRLVLPRGPKP